MTATVHKAIDLNDPRLEMSDKSQGYPTWKEADNRRSWQFENFVWVRTHDFQAKPEMIWSGKDGKTILVTHRDYSQEFYWDQYWDIYQRREDGSVLVKKMTIQEICSGRDDSIPMLTNVSEEIIEGECAVQISRDIDVCNALRAFAENRKGLELQADNTLPQKPFAQIIYPVDGKCDNDNQTVVSNLPRALFGHVAQDADVQKQQGKDLYDWLADKDSGFYQYRQNEVPWVEARDRLNMSYLLTDDDEYMNYNPEKDILVITHCVAQRKADAQLHYQIYEFISGQVTRTTMEISRSNVFRDTGRVTGIRRQLVTGEEELERVHHERNLAIEIVCSQKATQSLIDKAETDTALVTYKASGPQPS